MRNIEYTSNETDDRAAAAGNVGLGAVHAGENSSNDKIETSQDSKVARKRGRPKKTSDSPAEPTRAVNVPLSETAYRRLTMLKLNMPGESLKSIAARFIAEGLDRAEREGQSGTV